jgi:tetratricopeptide (TPR) repeat protein
MKNIKFLLFGLTILLINCSSQNAIKYIHSGDSKLNLGDIKEAIIDYNKAIEIDPNFAEAYINRGNAKSKLQDYIEAIADYTKALSINPSLVLALSNRGRCKLELKDYIGALNDCNKALSIVQDGFSYAIRGTVKICLKNYQDALSDFNKALENNYENGFVYYNRGIVKNFLNDTEGDCSDWSKAGEMGIKQAYEQISENCNKIKKPISVSFECSNCNEITFRNPEYVSTLDGEEELLYISIVNRTSDKIMFVTVKYRCLDSSGIETDSGDFEFDGNNHPLIGANSTKRKSVGLKFPVGGKIIFDVEYKTWPCPTDDPC